MGELGKTVFSAICLASVAACATAGSGPLSLSQARAYADTFARPGETVTKYVYSGVVGSAERVIALTESDAGLRAFLVDVSTIGGRREDLPPLHDTWSYQDIMEVLFEDVDGDGAPELLVIATYISGVGPNAAVPFPSVSVLDWTADGVVRRRDIEELAMVRQLDEGPATNDLQRDELVGIPADLLAPPVAE